MQTDEQLAARVAAGDEPALRELLRRYERPLGLPASPDGWARRRDLYQETWLRVVATLPFDAGRRFSTCFQIAVNLCRDWHRRPPPEPHVGIDRAGGAPVEPAEQALDAARLLAELPEAQREVVVLRYYQDLSEDEVATILDIPRGTVKSRLHHALARMARWRPTARGRDDRTAETP
jgi:RNA polymerase sigma-70 factor (ECF subfamily)